MENKFEVKESQLADLLTYVQSQLTYNQAVPIVNWAQNIIQNKKIETIKSEAK